MTLLKRCGVKLEKYYVLALISITCASLLLYILLSRQNVAGNGLLVAETLTHFFVTVAALFVLLLAAAMVIRIVTPQRHVQLILFIVVLGALLFRAMLLGQPPWLSNDIYRYLWDAQLIERGHNPYSFPPSANELAHMRDATIYPKVGHKDVHSVYPPLLQFLFWSGLKTSQAFGWPAFAGLKLLLVLIDVGLVLVLIFWLPQIDLDPRWAVLYAWHPLPIIEIAGSGHTDGVGACALLLMIAALMQRRFIAAVIFLALGFLVKFITVLFLPFLVAAAWQRFGPKKAALLVAIFVLLIAGSYAPFLEAGENLYSGLLVYSEKWRFNDGFFSLIFAPIHALLPDGLVKYLMIPADWQMNANTLITRRIDLALNIAKGIVAGLFLFIYLHLLRRCATHQSSPVEQWRWPEIAITILAAFFLLSPTLQPWYLLWILPLLCLRDIIPAFESSRKMIIPLWILSATVFLSYWVLFDYLSLGIWREAWWVKWVEYGIPAGSWLWLNHKSNDQ